MAAVSPRSGHPRHSCKLEEHHAVTHHASTLSYLASQGVHADLAVLPRQSQEALAVRQVPEDPEDLPFPLLASPCLPGRRGLPSGLTSRRVPATQASRETLWVRSLPEYRGHLNINNHVKLLFLRLIRSQTKQQNATNPTHILLHGKPRSGPAWFSSVKSTCWSWWTLRSQTLTSSSRSTSEDKNKQRYVVPQISREKRNNPNPACLNEMFAPMGPLGPGLPDLPMRPRPGGPGGPTRPAVSSLSRSEENNFY